MSKYTYTVGTIELLIVYDHDVDHEEHYWANYLSIPVQQTALYLGLQENHSIPEGELNIRIVSAATMLKINEDSTGKAYPTNILSFPSPFPSNYNMKHLGDLVICAEVVRREATEAQKPLYQHWAHLIVHGLLHLKGFDHIDNQDAEIMESHESNILKLLGHHDPYNN
jgi:probable rRNA maturation factor